MWRLFLLSFRMGDSSFGVVQSTTSRYSQMAAWDALETKRLASKHQGEAVLEASAALRTFAVI